MSTSKAALQDEQAPAKAKGQESHNYPLGSNGDPFPMTYIDSKTHKRKLGALEGKEGKHLWVNSELAYDEMKGIATRDMPTPGMLHLLQDIIKTTDPTDKSRNRVTMLLGDPGAGKSFIFNYVARLQTKRGAIMFDCGGRDLGEALYETVIDRAGNQSTFHAIDSALAEGKMNSVSIERLKEAFGPAFSGDGKSAAIDWDEAGKSRIDEKALATAEKALVEKIEKKNGEKLDFESDVESRKSDAWKEYNAEHSTLVQSFRDKADAAREHRLEVLNDVSRDERLTASGAGIGLKVVEGAFIRAVKENRPIILDEYNKAQPGSEDALQVVWQVFNGEMGEHTVSGGSGMKFQFVRDELPDMFWVGVTGNKPRDGVSTNQLSASGASRLKPKSIEPNTKEDWKHRIAQNITGLPTTTLHDVGSDTWDKNKEAFKGYLTAHRTMGLSDGKKANIPSWQFAMIQNVDKVNAAIDQLATFYDRWSQAMDPNSPLHTSTDANIKIDSKILDEVEDRDYQRQVQVDMRRMIKHILDARAITAEVSPLWESNGVDVNRDWSKAPEIAPQEPEATEKGFGSRLEQILVADIIASTTDDKQPKLELRKWLLRQAKDLNILEPDTQDAAKMAHTRLAARLNIDPEQEKLPEGLEEVHAMLAEHVRKNFKSDDGLQLSSDDTDIISPVALASVLTDIENKTEIDRPTLRSSMIYLPNSSDEKAFDEPVTPVVGKAPSFTLTEDFLTDPQLSPESVQLRQRLKKEEEGLNTDPLPISDMADAERFLISLAVPTLKDKNLEALWNKHARSDEMPLSFEPPAFQIIENRHESGVATQLVLTKSPDGNGGEKAEYLMVVHDSKGNDGKGLTLVTGTTEVSEKLQAALESQGVVYVNRDSADAESKITTVIDKITAGKDYTDKQNTNPFVHTLLESMVYNFMNPSKSKSVETPDGEHAPVGDGQRYDLPNNELLFSKSVIDNNERATPEWRQKSRTNLVAVLADRDDYLAKNAGNNLPFVVTESKDIEQLKHTLKALSNDGNQQASGQSVG